MNIGFTVFHSEQLDNKTMNRKENVLFLKNNFKQIADYIETDVAVIKDIKDYKIFLKNNSNFYNYKLYGKFRFGAIGLIFTTIMAYQKMLDLDYDFFIILEDDVQIKNDSVETVLEYIKMLPKDFDIFSMVEIGNGHKLYNKKHSYDSGPICYSYNRMSCSAYVISKNGINKYLELMTNIIDDPMDYFLFDFKKSTNQYAIKPKSKQPFEIKNLNDIGEPLINYSNINKTEEVFIDMNSIIFY